VWFFSVGFEIVEIFTKSLDFIIQTAVFIRNVKTVNVKVSVRAGLCVYVCKGKDKGKAVQLQAWTGLEGSRRLRLPDFKTIGT
jgi:hypothetical protein